MGHCPQAWESRIALSFPQSFLPGTSTERWSVSIFTAHMGKLSLGGRGFVTLSWQGVEPGSRLSVGSQHWFSLVPQCRLEQAPGRQA